MVTTRLVIRRFAINDWPDLHEYLSDERVVKYEPYPPFTEEQSKQAAEHRAMSEDFWAVCLKETGKVIGNIYLSEQEQQNWEIGYVFNFSYQHKGYATEAAKALIEMVFCDKSAHRIYANCNPENSPSWKLLERIGFQKEAHLRKNVYFNCSVDGVPLWQDTLIYGLLKEEWESAFME